MHIWSINLQQRRQEYTTGKGQSLQQMVLGKLDSNMQKNETDHFLNTIHKNTFKMDETPKCETGNHQNPGGEHRQ